MAIDFPNSPTLNQTYASGGKTWRWDGSSWGLVMGEVATDTVYQASTTNYDGGSPETIMFHEMDPIDSGEYQWATTTTRTNLVANPNFETTSTGWASAQASAARSTEYAYSGSASYKITMSSVSDSNISAIGAAVNTFSNTGTYTASAYVYVPSGSTLGGRTVSVSFEGGTATGTAGTSAPATLVAGSWARASRPFTVTVAGTKAIVFRLSGTLSTAVGQIIYLDSALSEFTNTLLPYFDGTYADTYAGHTLFSKEWNGTTNASTSTATWGIDSTLGVV